MNKGLPLTLGRGPVLIGLLLVALLLQLAVELLVIQPAQEALELTQAQKLRRELRQAKLEAQPSARVQTLSRMQSHEQVLHSLPDPLARLEQLQRIAAQEAVQLRSLSYAYATVSDQIEKITLQMDVEAHYPRLRQFIRAVHASDAATGLVMLNITQASSESGPLKAQLQFAVYAASGQLIQASAKRP